MASPFEKTIHLIDAAHAEDPSTVIPKDTSTSQTPVPSELHYANQMSHFLSLHTPSASDELKIAIRAQHLRRWEIPRSTYPATRAGYLSWRAKLKKQHAELAARYCRESGYDEDFAERVAALVRKEGIKKDEEAQALEDVACLVFLNERLETFEAEMKESGREMDEEQVIAVLRKTWVKMGERGRDMAVKGEGLDLGQRSMELVTKALAGES